jgi:putative membrane protein
MGYGPWGSGGVLMAVFMSLFWIVLLIAAGAIVWAVLHKGSAGIPHSDSGSALRILEERYARGEIGKEEFEQKRRDLQR